MTPSTLICLALALTACHPSPSGGDDDPGATIDANAGGDRDASGGGSDASGSMGADAATLVPTQFPITGPSPSSSPVIAGVTVSCHAMYAPRILRVYVIVTDPQGANDRATSSGTLKLPDGTMVALALGEPAVYSQYERWVKFGTGENLTVAQFDQTCAASLVELSLTMADKTGHVTLAPSVVVPPMVGGTL